MPFQILPISKAQLKSYTFLRLSLITPVLSEHLLFQIPMVHLSILLISLKNTQPLLVLYALSSLSLIDLRNVLTPHILYYGDMYTAENQ